LNIDEFVSACKERLDIFDGESHDVADSRIGVYLPLFEITKTKGPQVAKHLERTAEHYFCQLQGVEVYRVPEHRITDTRSTSSGHRRVSDGTIKKKNKPKSPLKDKLHTIVHSPKKDPKVLRAQKAKQKADAKSYYGRCLAAQEELSDVMAVAKAPALAKMIPDYLFEEAACLKGNLGQIIESCKILTNDRAEDPPVNISKVLLERELKELEDYLVRVRTATTQAQNHLVKSQTGTPLQ